MKKIVALVLVLALAFALCACGGRSGPNGTYKLSRIVIDGTDYTAYLGSTSYADLTITFNTDKSGAMVGSNANVRFTWTENAITDKSGTYSYRYEDDTIYLELQNVDLTFTR